MPEITREQMVDFLEKDIELDQNLIKNIPDGETKKIWEDGIVIKKAILVALEGPPLEKSWMKLAEELGVPFSAIKIIRDKLYTEMEGPGVKEVLVDELQEDDLIPLTPGGLKSLKNPPVPLVARVTPEEK